MLSDTAKRTIVAKKGRNAVLVNRLTKWAGVVHDFAGNFESAKCSGYKMCMVDGRMVVHVWKKS